MLIELLRGAAPARKMAMLLSANRTARLLALTGLRERHPGDSPAQRRRRLADLWLGAGLAAVEYLLGVLKVQAAALDRNYLIKAQPARFRGA